MSKKSKKRQSRSSRRSSQSATSARHRSSYTEEFDPDYSQTVKDLKRIGSLAGIFFAILLGLTFILH